MAEDIEVENFWPGLSCRIWGCDTGLHSASGILRRRENAHACLGHEKHAPQSHGHLNRAEHC